LARMLTLRLTMSEFDPTAKRLLVVLVVLAVAVTLDLGRTVFLPLVLALFAIAAAWPVVRRLEWWVPAPIAIGGAVVTVLFVAAVIGGAFVWGATALVEAAPQLSARIPQLCQQTSEWLVRRGMSPLGDGCTAGLEPWVGEPTRRAVVSAYSTMLMLGLAFAYLVLGLIEVRDVERKLSLRLPQRSASIIAAVRMITTKVRRHLVALTISSTVSGAATGAFTFAVGLELATTWGIMAFLLNYVPTVGPAVAVIPPTVYALVQFDSIARALAVLGGVGAIQFVMGNFVDPKIEGRVVSLSPFIVLLSVVLWGWIWGAFGAVLAVPIVIAIVVTCEQFESTRWIAALVSGGRHGATAGLRWVGHDRRAKSRTRRTVNQKLEAPSGSGHAER
jgi:AI-2 transport protein TqsA